MKAKSKILLALLAVIAAVCFFAFGASAENLEAATFDQLKTQLNTAATEKTVVLTADITVSSRFTVTATGKTNLDLNGHTLTFAKGISQAIELIEPNKAADINFFVYSSQPNGTIHAEGNSANLVYTNDRGKVYWGQNSAWNAETDNLWVYADCLVATQYGIGWAIEGGNYVMTGSGNFLFSRRVSSVKNAKFYAPANNYGCFVKAGETNVTFNNCTFCSVDGKANLLSDLSTVTPDFNNCTFIGVALKDVWGTRSVSLSGTTKLTKYEDNDATVELLGAGKIAALGASAEQASFTLGGETYTADFLTITDKTAAFTVERAGAKEYYLEGATVANPDTSSASYLDAPNGQYYAAKGEWAYELDGETVTIGTVSADMIGKTATASVDFEEPAPVVLSYVIAGQVGAVYGEDARTLKDIFAICAGTDNVIILYSDITLTETPVLAGKTVKLDLNGHTVNGAELMKTKHLFQNDASAHLIVYSSVAGAKVIGADVTDGKFLFFEDSSSSVFTLGAQSETDLVNGKNVCFYGPITNGYGKTNIVGGTWYALAAGGNTAMTGNLMNLSNNQQSVLSNATFYSEFPGTFINFNAGDSYWGNGSFKIVGCTFIAPNSNMNLFYHANIATKIIILNATNCTFIGTSPIFSNTVSGTTVSSQNYSGATFGFAADIPDFLLPAGKVRANYFTSDPFVIKNQDGVEVTLAQRAAFKDASECALVTFDLPEGQDDVTEYWLLGETPVAPKAASEWFDAATDKLYYVKGWKAGETAIENVVLTEALTIAADVDSKDLVYIVLTADGEIHSYAESVDDETDGSAFAAIVKSIASRVVTVRLLEDVTVGEYLVNRNANVTYKLDLNGHTLTYTFNNNFIFAGYDSSIKADIFSSKPGAIVRATDFTGGAVCAFQTDKGDSDLVVDATNVIFYVGSVLNGWSDGSKFSLTGGTFYLVNNNPVNAPALFGINGATLTVKDAKFYSVGCKLGSIVNQGKNYGATFENCEFFSTVDVPLVVAASAKDKAITFTDCTLVGVTLTAGSATGVSVVTTDTGHTYLSASDKAAILGETDYDLKANLLFTETVDGEEYTFTATRLLTNDAADVATVNFKNAAGTLVATEQWAVGSLPSYESASPVFGFFKYEGAAAGALTESENDVTVALTVETKGSVKTALTLYVNLDVNLYFDADVYTGAKVNGTTYTFDAETEKATVGEKEYYVVVYPGLAANVAGAAFEVVGLVGADALEYSFTTSVPAYLTKLADNGSEELSALAVSLLTYIKAAALDFNSEADTALVDAALAVYAEAGVTADTEFAPEGDLDVDLTDAPILSAAIVTDAHAGYAFEMASDYTGAVCVTFTSYKGETFLRYYDPTEWVDVDETMYVIVDDFGIHEFVSEITVSAPEKDGYDAVEFTYSVDHYLAGTEVEGEYNAVALALRAYARDAMAYYASLLAD